MRYARKDRCPEGGYVACYSARRGKDRARQLPAWHLNRCPRCKVVIWPSVIRWLDYGWLSWRARRALEDARYERELRKKDKEDRQ
jgi:hypothetical protein